MKFFVSVSTPFLLDKDYLRSGIERELENKASRIALGQTILSYPGVKTRKLSLIEFHCIQDKDGRTWLACLSGQEVKALIIYTHGKIQAWDSFTINASWNSSEYKGAARRALLALAGETDVLVSDAFHTEAGNIMWLKLCKEGEESGFKIGIINNLGEDVLYLERKELENVPSIAWGKINRYEQIRLALFRQKV